MNLNEMTGLQFMQAHAQGLLPKPGMAITVPMEFELVEPNRVVFLVTANETHTNPVGGVHGGFAATVLDSVTACAISTTLAVGERCTTIELNVKMCKAIPFNTQLRAEGTVINVTNRLAIAEGYIRDENGVLYAYGTSTCMMLR